MNSVIAKETSKFIWRKAWKLLPSARPRCYLSSTCMRGLPHMISRNYSHSARSMAETVKVTYIEADGTEKVIDADVGKNLMDIAHDNDVELEGACGGELACSTCHLIFEEEIYKTLPEKEDEEDDMLDLAFEVTETSRLGCQILVREDMDGMTVRIPDDGF